MAAETRKRPRSLFRRTLLLMLAAAAAVGAMIWATIARMEQGMLDVCAAQQDGYVQLVLDQIALQSGHGDQAIIEDILATLDASSRKYWVFSKGETMLFVKDVAETNKYKGFTAASYYASDSAQAFLNTLQPDHVRHDFIELDGKRYVASGAIFTYDGVEYRLCLLTNRDMVLENNAYLRGRSELWAAILALLALFVCVPAYLAHRADALRRQTEADRGAIAELQRELSAMNDRYAGRDWRELRARVLRPRERPGAVPAPRRKFAARDGAALFLRPARRDRALSPRRRRDGPPLPRPADRRARRTRLFRPRRHLRAKIRRLRHDRAALPGIPAEILFKRPALRHFRRQPRRAASAHVGARADHPHRPRLVHAVPHVRGLHQRLPRALSEPDLE